VYVVMRLSCLQEDEGRSFVVAVVNTREEAVEVIESRIAMDGYFSRGDYIILKEDKCTQSG
jgi:hypothetical protein